jgi:hypothetical protein
MTIDELPFSEELQILSEKYGKSNLRCGPRVISMTTCDAAYPILLKEGNNIRKVGEVRAPNL